jgi:hypothetical protein
VLLLLSVAGGERGEDGGGREGKRKVKAGSGSRGKSGSGEEDAGGG